MELDDGDEQTVEQLVLKTFEESGLGLKINSLNRMLSFETVSMALLNDALKNTDDDPAMSALNASDVLRKRWSTERLKNQHTYILDFILDC